MIKLSHVNKNDNIMVALSGGKDSMCLFSILYSMKEEYNLTLSAVNIEHGIRGDDSKKDSLFVKNYCEKLNIPIKSFSVDAVKFSKENGYTLEQGARILRYNIFEDLLKADATLKIATAHHQSDNVESVLFNLFRGTGLKGMSGINANVSRIIRPLIDVKKSEINEYVDKNNIPFVQDLTNFDSAYSRNFIRNELLTKIDEKFPMAIDNINAFSRLAKEEDEFLDNLAKKYIDFDGDNLSILTDTPLVLLKRAVIMVLKEYGVKKDYTKKHIDACVNLSTGKNGSYVVLANEIKVVKEYEKLVFYYSFLEKDEKVYAYNEGTFTLSSAIIGIEKSPIVKENALNFDGDKIPKNAVIRTRRNGDIFTKFAGGTKKLKDYFIDKKIKRFKRDLIPLIAVDNQVLLIFGVEISEQIKIDKNTKNINTATIYKGE
jgi:tRNA(Ile)-lysidine synthase